MGGIGHFISNPPNSILIWTPILFFGAIVYLLWRTLQAMPRVRPAAIEAQSGSTIGWGDVAGLEEVKEELSEVVEFLQHPERFERLGARGTSETRRRGRGDGVSRRSRREQRPDQV